MTSAALLSVERLLHEFYQPSTTNARKRECETELLAFKHSSEAWQLCLRVTAYDYNNTSQFMWFFASSTLEHAITRLWPQLSAADRQLIRETLWNAYVNLGNNETPRQQRDTLAQLMALLGKREFPDDHPDYMAHCLTLLKSNLPLGLTLLRVTSEEVVSNRDDVSTDRKNYFHSCISMCMPEVLDLLTKYLLIAVCHINDKDVQTLSASSANFMDYTLLATLPNDNQMRGTLLEMLNCAQHLVSWISTELIADYFLMSTLDLAQWRGSATGQQQEVALAALSVLNELLYLQKALPAESTLVVGVCGLLEQQNAAKQPSEMYVDKFRELLRLCTAKYWHKLLGEGENGGESQSLFERFLKSLYSFTTMKNGAMDFTEKLEIWSPIVKGMALNAKLGRYNDVLYQLVAEIMRRTQFQSNKSELELLDNEILEDNTQTEWQQFLTQCIECIALVAESTRPHTVFAQVFSHWSRPHVYLMSLQQDIDSGRSIELAQKFKGGGGVAAGHQSLAEYLRDCSTICQAVVRIAPLLDVDGASGGGSLAEVQTYLQTLIDMLLATLTFCSSNKLGALEPELAAIGAFQTDLDYLYAHVLMALRSVLAIKAAPLKSDETTLYRLFDALGGIFQSSTATLAPIVYMAASELLLCIATITRPKCLLDIPAVHGLLQAGPRLCHLPRQVIANVYVSMISCLVLPWRNMPDTQQDYTRRCTLLREYVDCLAQSFLGLDVMASEAKVLAISVNFLGTFSLVVEFFRDCNNASKEMLVTALKPVNTKALHVYNTFGAGSSNSSSAVGVAVAEYYLSVFRALQTQLGAQFVREIITLFINVSSREPLTLTRLAVMERLLQMFQLIAQQPGNASLSLIAPILDFSITQMLPLLQRDTSLADNSDVASIVYSLFDNILTHKWQYFYKAHLQQPQTQNGNTSTSENLQPQHFLGILNAYGQVLVGCSDPCIVRTVLLSMQQVNERWRLYQRPLFRDNLLASFQGALIQALLSGEGAALHQELVTNALFAMGQVDTLKLRERFAAAAGNLKIIDDICLATDIPTFSQKLEQFIQDARAYS